MKALRVNADYELILSGPKNPPKLINQSLEFLALFLEDRPLFTTKAYSKEYLAHVKKLSGYEPRLVSYGEYENWWGSLKDIELEKRLNSKSFSATFSAESTVIKAEDPIYLEEGKTYLMKGSLGMSGQGIFLVKKGDEDKVKKNLESAQDAILEPLLNRDKDFSHYIFPSGKMICYENFVNERFQYKGTLFNDLSSPTPEGLRFFSEVNKDEWARFFEKLKRVKNIYTEESLGGGYSVDSFTFDENGKKLIRAVTEINYRKTMGLVAWKLSQKFSGPCNWSLLILGKPLKRDDAFSFIQERVGSLSGVYHLSPGDTRFEVFFLTAQDEKQGGQLLGKLKNLLPGCEFTINV